MNKKKLRCCCYSVEDDEMMWHLIEDCEINQQFANYDEDEMMMQIENLIDDEIRILLVYLDEYD